MMPHARPEQRLSTTMDTTIILRYLTRHAHKQFKGESWSKVGKWSFLVLFIIADWLVL